MIVFVDYPNRVRCATAVQPSGMFERQEVVVIMEVAPGGQKQNFLPVSRGGNGKFAGLANPTRQALLKAGFYHDK